ncbi:MAG: pyrimidine utilization transport protein G [Chloroflexi bacterium]|jgi:putative pyrimidine permease RutG|nr:MAG: pyrimidine utilization transport protein G [Ktedonobacter sp. 13_2_20CM_2_56_8]TMB84917.1 MAG: pyrimidine utilization transport protein G [Chloroflexota bacterium]TMC94566.1 MAG: pyrimidine utilization transport protein G [Chloroflexota bacterium]TMD79907.1 MAG: pyrimidine utilization transport protein G [Chloroflexota bacterium]TMD94080.1 MAG: pyrimidine utilization transport protein G [Chloroflexota bacterium]
MATVEKRGYFTGWTLKKEGIIAPEERLPWGQSIFVGLQHVLAMFGSTVLAPIIMGFDPNTAIFFSGIGTLIFFLVVGGRVPSYLGSSFSFIAVVIAATAYSGKGPNTHIDVALGGIIAAGVVYAIIGIIVIFVGYKWIEYLMPPVVTGAVVAAIGLNLAPVAVSDAATSQFDTWMAIVTVLAVAAVAVYLPGPLRRLPILIGGIIGYIIYLIFANGFGLGKAIDFTGLSNAAWVGLPNFTTPTFHANAMALIAPVAIILVAENLGHVKAVGAMTGRSLDKYLGRAFLGDALATIVSASGGGTGVTTYAENIGVMAVTRIYSTLIFIIAAVVAILLGFSPKFGALIHTIPPGVLGGLAIVLFGLIAATGGRIWVQNGVDFSKSRNLITVAVALTLGAGNFVLNVGTFSIGGIGTATFGSIILYQILRERGTKPEEVATADAAVNVEPGDKGSLEAGAGE